MRMTASKPKKVSRTMDPDLNPDHIFLLCEGPDGGIPVDKAPSDIENYTV